MKKLTAILAGATALVAVSTSAHAAPTIVYSPVVNGTFSAGFFNVLTGKSFNNSFASFTVGAAGAGDTLTGSLSSSSAISFSTAGLYKGTTLISSFVGDSLTPVVLSEGTYFLKFVGTDTPPASYAGTLNFSAVPEPAAWSLMILGFGAVGFAMRRQRATYRVAYN